MTLWKNVSVIFIFVFLFFFKKCPISNCSLMWSLLFTGKCLNRTRDWHDVLMCTWYETMCTWNQMEHLKNNWLLTLAKKHFLFHWILTICRNIHYFIQLTNTHQSPSVGICVFNLQEWKQHCKVMLRLFFSFYLSGLEIWLLWPGGMNCGLKRAWHLTLRTWELPLLNPRFHW